MDPRSSESEALVLSRILPVVAGLVVAGVLAVAVVAHAGWEPAGLSSVIVQLVVVGEGLVEAGMLGL